MYNIHKKFENHLATIATEFTENLEKYESVISVYHTDADGVGSAAVIKEMLKRLRVPFTQVPNTLEESWEDFMHGLEKNTEESSAIIFSDLCPPVSVLNEFLELHAGIEVYILDHHLMRFASGETLHENAYNCNPTQFGLDGLKEIVGVTLNYLFAKEVDQVNEKWAWLAALTMAGDTLQHFDEYQSYNRLVAEKALAGKHIEVREGLCVFGGMFERVDKALTLSILPFVPEVAGEQERAQNILKKLGINPYTKVEDLNLEQVDDIVRKLDNPRLRGEYLIVPKKRTLLHHTFEHAQLISILGHDNQHQAFALLSARSATKEQKQKYLDYITQIITNLSTFVKIPKIETETSIIVDLTDKLPSDQWSDTASFSTINKIYDTSKILLLGGVKDGQLKLSVRCTTEFIESHNGVGAKKLIEALSKKVGGRGGGHDLAGGYRIQPEMLEQLNEKIDEVMKSLQ